MKKIEEVTCNCCAEANCSCTNKINDLKKSYSTVSRKKMLEYLQSCFNRTVSVNEVREYLQQEGCEVNITTIYRFMDKLAKEGNVIKYVAQKGDMAVYQYVGEGRNCEEHLHLQCVKCGHIIHMDCDFMEEIATHIEDHHEFSMQCKNSIIYGLCKNCKACV